MKNNPFPMPFPPHQVLEEESKILKFRESHFILFLIIIS